MGNVCSYNHPSIDDLVYSVDNYMKYNILQVQKVIYSHYNEPKKVIFNPPATIIIWNDGSKSVVKAQNGEPYDREKGFVMAYLKKLLGNDNTFNKEIHKWVDMSKRT